MRTPLRVAAVYGLLFHAVVAAIVVWVARSHRARIEPGFWWVAVPLVLAAGAGGFALVAGPYLRRRNDRRRGVVLVDALVGMLAECVTVVQLALLFGAVAAARTGGGAAAALAAFASNASFVALYAAASFLEQILVVGNAAGLVGWWLLKRAGRVGASAPHAGAPSAGPAGG